MRYAEEIQLPHVSPVFTEIRPSDSQLDNILDKGQLPDKNIPVPWLFSTLFSPALPSHLTRCLPTPHFRCPMDSAHMAGVTAGRLPAAPPASHSVFAQGVQDHSRGGVHRGARHPRPAPHV